MKKIKLIFFLSWDLTPRYIEHFCLDSLADEFDLEFWDLSKISVPMTITKEPTYRDYVRHVNSLKQLHQMLSKLPKDTLGVIYLDQCPEMYDVHKEISRFIPKGIFMYFNKSSREDEQERGFVNKGNETPKANHSLYKRIKQILYEVRWIHIVSKFVRYRGDERFKHWYNQSKGELIHKLYNDWVEINNCEDNEYRTNHPDYDKVLQIGPSHYNGKPYILFIDEYWPLHPCWEERAPGIDFSQYVLPYQKSMTKFFDRVEQYYKMDVVIAAHPVANYNNDAYGGRKIIKYKSIELTRDCQAVIMHASNSSNFVAYYNKPLVIVTNDSIESVKDDVCYGSLSGNIESLSRRFKIEPINVDHDYDIRQIFKTLDQDMRVKYINKYLGDENEKQTTAEQLKKHFYKIYNRFYGKHSR